MIERSRQYETNVKVGTSQQKLDFKKGDNPATRGKYFTTSYIPRASDVAVLSKHLDQLTSLKTEVNKLKKEVVAMDQGFLIRVVGAFLLGDLFIMTLILLQRTSLLSQVKTLQNLWLRLMKS